VIGGDDPIADPAVSEPLAHKVHGAEVHLLRGFKHEVWNERERAHPLGLTGTFVAKLARA
jgi:alpha-beta hydrolase superfamily lysophospholipase